ncbi:MAG: UxaA family hydrolase [Thermocladium sp.]|jgi:(2R)-sulfolactate sulfo-lyase subunit alpha
MPRAIIHNENDNVAVAINDIKRGDEVECIYLSSGESKVKIKANQDILLGHKIALKNIMMGDIVVKYGRPIGRAVTNISVGDHVHIHNIKSIKWGTRGSRNE